MNTVPLTTVERTWREIESMSPVKGEELIKLINKEQPVLLAYLLAAGEKMLSEKERELLVYLGVIVWRIMSQETKKPAKVNENLLFTNEDANLALLRKIGKDRDRITAGAAALLDNYNQLHILSYTVNFLMEGATRAKGFQIREEKKGIMMIYLKTVIDCLDEAA